MRNFWQLFKGYYKRVWSRALSDTTAILGVNKTTFWLFITTLVAWWILWRFFHWNWAQLSEEITTGIAAAVAIIGVGLLIFMFRLIAAPVLIDEEQRWAIDRATKSGLFLSQPRGHGDNIHSVYDDSDPRIVVIRDVIVVNRSDKDEVVSLKLWLPLNHNGLLFSPQTTLPSKDIGHVSLLKAVENIPARQSAPGDLLFKITRNSVPNISPSFFIIIVTSQLTGIEHAVNTMNFTEVKKPYPRNLDELNEQLASGFSATGSPLKPYFGR
jgi:hypothetical protein